MKLHEDKSMYIHGWKGIAAYLGVSVRTAKRWHYELIKIPFVRLGGLKGSHSRISIMKPILDLWVSHVGRVKKELVKNGHTNSNTNLARK